MENHTIDCSLEKLEEIRKGIPNTLLVDDVVPFEIEIPFEIKSHDFLSYAQSDLELTDEQNLINCLSNCKRAIECQVDALLFSLGMYEKSKKGWNFHKKIEFLNQFGIISPRILKKINKHRNLLEHGYFKPDREKVEDAVDIAILFLNYTDKYLKSAIVFFNIIIDDIYLVEVTLDYENGKIMFAEAPIDYDGVLVEAKTLKEISASSTEYFGYLTWFFSIEKRLSNW